MKEKLTEYFGQANFNINAIKGTEKNIFSEMENEYSPEKASEKLNYYFELVVQLRKKNIATSVNLNKNKMKLVNAEIELARLNARPLEGLEIEQAKLRSEGLTLEEQLNKEKKLVETHKQTPVYDDFLKDKSLSEAQRKQEYTHSAFTLYKHRISEARKVKDIETELNKISKRFIQIRKELVEKKIAPKVDKLEKVGNEIDNFVDKNKQLINEAQRQFDNANTDKKEVLDKGKSVKELKLYFDKTRTDIQGNNKKISLLGKEYHAKTEELKNIIEDVRLIDQIGKRVVRIYNRDDYLTTNFNLSIEKNVFIQKIEVITNNFTELIGSRQTNQELYRKLLVSRKQLYLAQIEDRSMQLQQAKLQIEIGEKRQKINDLAKKGNFKSQYTQTETNINQLKNEYAAIAEKKEEANNNYQKITDEIKNQRGNDDVKSSSATLMLTELQQNTQKTEELNQNSQQNTQIATLNKEIKNLDSSIEKIEANMQLHESRLNVLSSEIISLGIRKGALDLENKGHLIEHQINQAAVENGMTPPYPSAFGQLTLGGQTQEEILQRKDFVSQEINRLNNQPTQSDLTIEQVSQEIAENDKKMAYYRDEAANYGIDYTSRKLAQIKVLQSELDGLNNNHRAVQSQLLTSRLALYKAEQELLGTRVNNTIASEHPIPVEGPNTGKQETQDILNSQENPTLKNRKAELAFKIGEIQGLQNDSGYKEKLTTPQMKQEIQENQKKTAQLIQQNTQEKSNKISRSMQTETLNPEHLQKLFDRRLNVLTTELNSFASKEKVLGLTIHGNKLENEVNEQQIANGIPISYLNTEENLRENEQQRVEIAQKSGFIEQEIKQLKENPVSQGELSFEQVTAEMEENAKKVEVFNNEIAKQDNDHTGQQLSRIADLENKRDSLANNHSKVQSELLSSRLNLYQAQQEILNLAEKQSVGNNLDDLDIQEIKNKKFELVSEIEGIKALQGDPLYKTTLTVPQMKEEIIQNNEKMTQLRDTSDKELKTLSESAISEEADKEEPELDLQKDNKKNRYKWMHRGVRSVRFLMNFWPLFTWPLCSTWITMILPFQLAAYVLPAVILTYLAINAAYFIPKFINYRAKQRAKAKAKKRERSTGELQKEHTQEQEQTQQKKQNRGVKFFKNNWKRLAITFGVTAIVGALGVALMPAVFIPILTAATAPAIISGVLTMGTVALMGAAVGIGMQLVDKYAVKKAENYLAKKINEPEKTELKEQGKELINLETEKNKNNIQLSERDNTPDKESKKSELDYATIEDTRNVHNENKVSSLGQSLYESIPVDYDKKNSKQEIEHDDLGYTLVTKATKIQSESPQEPKKTISVLENAKETPTKQSDFQQITGDAIKKAEQTNKREQPKKTQEQAREVS
ncbi:hypothetical protein IGL98_000480 [Enterococcus sp. DIV0840]|uniref:hypothetical protein n=1 Tax=unclassified Enterococcus TaxID=2608891 RepID=UPI001A8DD60C|nr:hypothetical protein [Enterococcus sp. DIV0849a]MBO0433523.1 hypothetical protein [Enterococcus sp. DIV0849a]